MAKKEPTNPELPAAPPPKHTPRRGVPIQAVPTPDPDSAHANVVSTSTTSTRQEIPAELLPLFQVAMESLPPKWKGYLLAAAVPLVLTTWTNLRQIWEAPATQAQITTELTKHATEMEGLKTQYKTLEEKMSALEKKIDDSDEKLDRLLWLQQTQGGNKAWPSTQPGPR